MKVVVDEGVPRVLVRLLSELGTDAHYFPHEWRGMSNGKLINAAETSGFACLLTNDRNMANQTNLQGRRLCVVALPSNKASAIKGRARDIADTIRQSLPGQHIAMDMDGTRLVRTSAHRTVKEAELLRIEPFKSER